MKLITDAAANLSPERAAELGVEVVPFQVTFMGKTYKDGVDIHPENLYQMYIDHPDEYVTTSQPSVGDLLKTYEKYPGEEILSVHLSSGLSGAYSSAEHAARMMEDQRVTVVDSHMVGPALGWMVETAAHGIRLNWSLERIIEAMRTVQKSTLTMVTFSDMKYLIHSGRVSHLKSIVASILKIKPIIGMNEEDGRYSNIGQDLTFGRAIHKLVERVHKRFDNEKLRIQLMHGSNLPGVDILRKTVNEMLNGKEDLLVPVTLVLGAHAGPTVIGLAAAPQAVFDQLYG
ncbi:MAG TPA: DegV family protein [Anaerolineaceae bacterium]|nr:DegV family protein [Anaerolineaceae bacterium]HPN53476.1 DegV family protein [Anaerolineaceae bacterium]